MTIQVGEEVQALFDGAWYPARIETIERDGVYTVKWNTKCPTYSKGYMGYELISTSWRNQHTTSSHDLQTRLGEHFERMESGSFSDTDTSSMGSLEDEEEWNVQEGVKIAQDMLERLDQYTVRDAQLQNFDTKCTKIELESEMWVAATPNGAPCYRIPDLNNPIDQRINEVEIVVALEMVHMNNKRWIVIDEGIWIPADAMKPLLKPEYVKEERVAWLFDGCPTVELQYRRAVDCVIRNTLCEEKFMKLPASRHLDKIQLFFPTIEVTSELRSIQEICGLANYRWGDDSLEKEVLGRCLLSLWMDVRAVSQRSPEEIDLRLVRFLVKHRFDSQIPEFLRFVLQTGKIRIAKYLYSVGPLINKEWTTELANGIAKPLHIANCDVLYDNIQSLMKFGYRLPLEKIIRAWSRVSYIEFKWKHDRALRTFRSSARLNRYAHTTKNKIAILRGCCRKRGLSERPESLIMDYINAFRHYNVSPDAHLPATDADENCNEWRNS